MRIFTERQRKTCRQKDNLSMRRCFSLGWLLIVCGLALFSSGQTQVLPRLPQPAHKVITLDVSRETWETRATLACLQGIINRKQPRLYLLHSPTERTWLDWLLERRYLREAEAVATPDALIARFRSEIRGAVVWDSALPETVNIASMEASLQQAVATTAERAAQWKLPVLLDLRGKWKTAAEALDWSLVHLKPKLRPRVMACLFPQMNGPQPRDYAVAVQAFQFWCDDKAALEKVARAFPPNTPLVGYWGHGFPDQPGFRGLTEYEGLLILSRWGQFSSGSEFSCNWSLHAGIRVPASAFRRAPLPAPALDTEKIYIAMHVVESGDALWYWERRQRAVWENPALGAAPIGWCVNPTARDVLPAVLEWYYRRAPANQEFYGAISGLGYFSAPDFGTLRPEREAVWKAHLSALRPYLRSLSLRGVAQWMGPWRVPDDYRAVLSRYAAHLPEAAFLLPDMGRAENLSYAQANYALGSSIVLHCRSRWRLGGPTDTEGEIAWLAEEIRKNTPTARPAFLSVMAYSWTHDPATMKAVLERLGPEYVPVTPSQLAALYALTAVAR